jgi:hypothetical protein
LRHGAFADPDSYAEAVFGLYIREPVLLVTDYKKIDPALKFRKPRMRTWIAVFCVTACLVTCAFAQNRSPNAQVTGVVQAFDGKTLTLRTADGSLASAPLAADVAISFNVKRTLADIKPGDFIASGGTRGADGKIHANEIRIFSGVRGEGQFPMTEPGHVMTNATVKEIMTGATVKQVGKAGGMPTIKLTFHGAGAPGAANCTGRSSDAPGGAGKGCIGETWFDVPPGVPVVAVLPGTTAMLKPGVKASMNLARGGDGTTAATRISIGP